MFKARTEKIGNFNHRVFTSHVHEYDTWSLLFINL